jgi:hypothetical protein
MSEVSLSQVFTLVPATTSRYVTFTLKLHNIQVTYHLKNTYHWMWTHCTGSSQALSMLDSMLVRVELLLLRLDVLGHCRNDLKSVMSSEGKMRD